MIVNQNNRNEGGGDEIHVNLSHIVTIPPVIITKWGINRHELFIVRVVLWEIQVDVEP